MASDLASVIYIFHATSCFYRMMFYKVVKTLSLVYTSMGQSGGCFTFFKTMRSIDELIKTSVKGETEKV